MFERLFLAHPRSVGESYFEHLCAAGSFALALFGAAGACLVHAIVPGLFEHTASKSVNALYERMVQHRGRATVSAQTIPLSAKLDRT